MSSSTPYRWPAVLTSDVAQATRDMEAQAHKQGFDAGFAEGRAAGMQSLASTLEAAQSLVSELEQRLRHDEATLEVFLARLIADVAQAACLHALTVDETLITALIRHGLDALEHPDYRTIRLNPADAEACTACSSLQFESDPGLSPGQMQIDCDGFGWSYDINQAIRDYVGNDLLKQAPPASEADDA